jgi:hypothetical protein
VVLQSGRLQATPNKYTDRFIGLACKVVLQSGRLQSSSVEGLPSPTPLCRLGSKSQKHSESPRGHYETIQNRTLDNKDGRTTINKSIDFLLFRLKHKHTPHNSHMGAL